MTSRRSRLPLLAAGILAMAYGVGLGLVRLGWELPLPPAHLRLHGPLMVAGFLGTVIGLERAVALGQTWAYAAPLLAALGSLATLAGLAPSLGPSLVGLSSVLLVAVYARVLQRQPTLFTGVMAAGALCWLAGNLLWIAGAPLPHLVFLWAAFLILTIAGERLELTRFLKPTRYARVTFLSITAILAAGVVAVPLAPAAGHRLTGLGLLGFAFWFARYDIARRTVRQPGLTRFVALCLLTGYAWLALGGALTLAFASSLTGPVYDAAMHAIFLGFVFAMIFGHAPIIFPALLRGSMTFRPAFYLHLGLLHAALLARTGGDLGLAMGVEGALPWRLWGGLLNAAAVGLFLLNTVRSLRLDAPGPQARREQDAGQPRITH